MKNDLLTDLHSLISDTLLFLHDSYLIEAITAPTSPSSVIMEVKIKESPPKIAVPPSKPPVPVFKEEARKSESKLKTKDETMLKRISEHLPHLTIVHEILQRKQFYEAIILVGDKKELPFLQNLAKAIKQHFCPVKLIDMQKIQTMNKWDKFFSDKKNTLFLMPASLKESFPSDLKGIFLVETYLYAQNIENKKRLWAEICQTLKPSTQK